MKRFFIYIGIVTALSCGMSACEKEGIMTYDRERAAIEFSEVKMEYSFRFIPEAVDTLSIPFNIVGVPSMQERMANIDVMHDSTTATKETFEIISAIVPAGERSGTLKVKLTNTQGADFEDAFVYFRMGANDYFIPGTKELNDLKLRLTNNLVRPPEWDEWLAEFFWGTYSSAYYAFIIQATGETRFPYYYTIPDYNNGEEWTESEKNAFLEKVRYELRERNKRVGSPLLHDDGNAKGKEVIVGYYYGY